jgi:hypothetical protein
MSTPEKVPVGIIAAGVAVLVGFAAVLFYGRKDDEKPPLPGPKPGPDPNPAPGESKTFTDANKVVWTFYGYSDGAWEASPIDASVDPGYVVTFGGPSPDSVREQIIDYAAKTNPDGSPKAAPLPDPVSASILGTVVINDANSLPWLVEHWSDDVYRARYIGPPGMNENGAKPSPYEAIYMSPTPVFTGTSNNDVEVKIMAWTKVRPFSGPI